MHEAAMVAESQGHNLEGFQTTQELLVLVSDLMKHGTIAMTDVAQFDEAMNVILIVILRRRMAHTKHM